MKEKFDPLIELVLIALLLTGFLETFPQLSWSYSKYMAALRREEVLLRRQSLLEASSSTASGTHTHLPSSQEFSKALICNIFDKAATRQTKCSEP